MGSVSFDWTVSLALVFLIALNIGKWVYDAGRSRATQQMIVETLDSFKAEISRLWACTDRHGEEIAYLKGRSNGIAHRAAKTGTDDA